MGKKDFLIIFYPFWHLLSYNETEACEKSQNQSLSLERTTMNDNLNDAKLNLDELEEISGGKYRPKPGIPIAKNDPDLKRVICKRCGNPFQADPKDPNPKCPYCPDNDKFSV